MKKIVLFLVSLIILGNINANALNGKSVIVMDMDSGRILYQRDINTKRLIASITKIMTAVIAIENKNLDDLVVVGEEVLPMYGTNIYIEVGEELTLRDLLYGLILRSGNDAAVSIATYVGGNEEKFVKLMNEKAKKIGMNNTIFNNSHGLDEKTKNYSTALDMAKLMSYANKLKDFVEISGTKKYSTRTNKKSYVWYNRNKFLSLYEYATGGKTGYTPKAGKTLVSTASKNNLNLVAVSLNDPNHYDSQKVLFDKIFSKYENVLIIDKNNIKFDNSYYNDLYINYSFRYPLTKDEKNKIKIHVDFYNEENINNSKVGEIYVMFDNQEIYREYIYNKDNTNKEKEQDNIFLKIINFFNSLFS